MRADRRSRTAEATAAMRAAHLLLDEEPRVLDDRFAARLLAPEQRLGLLPLPLVRRSLDLWRLRRRFPSWLQTLPATGSRRSRAQIVVRSRYAEDCVRDAVARGVDQYVVLAAGLDSFGLRCAELGPRLAVLEVDHPATQSWKRQRVESIVEEWPSHLSLVPFDFEHQSLSQALAASDFDPQRPAIFSWLGVTYYLSDEAIDDTLRFFAGLAPGTEVVLDYWSDSGLSNPADAALLAAIRVAVAAQGEPMLSFFTPQSMKERFAARGLNVREMPSAAETGKRYLAGRSDGLLLPEFAYLARVVVS